MKQQTKEQLQDALMAAKNKLMYVCNDVYEENKKIYYLLDTIISKIENLQNKKELDE